MKMKGGHSNARVRAQVVTAIIEEEVINRYKHITDIDTRIHDNMKILMTVVLTSDDYLANI